MIDTRSISVETTTITLDSVTIRTELRPGDLGTITALHGVQYAIEYGWGIGFEAYVAEGLAEFYSGYGTSRNHIWIAEHDGKIVGCLALVDRADAAQLRYYLVLPECRGIGLGKRLMELFMEHYRSADFGSAYLWTTSDLSQAASLYARFGFVLTEEKAGDQFGKAVTEQRYDLRTS